MATVTVTDTTIEIELSLVEQLGCFRKGIVIPREHVHGVDVADEPLRSLRGIRAPGIGWPGALAIGRWRHRGGTDLVIVRRRDRALVIDVENESFRRVVVGVGHPESLAQAIAA